MATPVRAATGCIDRSQLVTVRDETALAQATNYREWTRAACIAASSVILDVSRMGVTSRWSLT